MKTVSGGITSHADSVHINISIDGGDNHTRAYPNTIESAIGRLRIINQAIQTIPLDLNMTDMFLIRELIHLFREADLDILPGSGPYQQMHNAQVLIGYIQTNTLEFSDREALRLLGSDRVVHELNADCETQFIPIEYWPVKTIVINDKSLKDLYDQLRMAFDKYIDLLEAKKTQLQTEYNRMLQRINACLAKSE